MDDENFMEKFKAKDIYSFINYHIKDLVNVRNKLDEKMLNQLEKSWDKYSYENYLNRDEYKALRIAKVQVVNAEKGLNNKFVKKTITGGIGYDEPCPTRYPRLLSGLMMRIHEEFQYYQIHVNKFMFYDYIARTSYALEKKHKNLTKHDMCKEVLSEQIKLLTVWKQDFANAMYFERFNDINKENKTLYFAYGKNCNNECMLERCPGAKQIGEAVLYNHTFIIDERGQGGGFSSVKRQEGSEVRGIAWLIPNNEIKNNLDKAEGVNMTPPVYRKETLKIHILGTDQFNVEALVYVSNQKEGFYARDDYIETILTGLKQNLVYEFDEKSYRSHIKLS